MEQLFVEALKMLGPSALPVVILWWRGKEMREDYREQIAALRAENAEFRKQLLDLMKDSIKSEFATSVVLEKIADKVGA